MMTNSLAAAKRDAEVKRPAPKTKRNFKRRLIPLAFLAVGIGAAWYGYRWWSESRFIESTDDAYIGADVTVISPKVSGYIAQVMVRDNQTIHAGDVLVRLDARDFRAALTEAEGKVAAQRALLANLDATRQLQEAVIAQAKAGITATGAEVRRSHDDRERYRALSVAGAVSLQSTQKADADYKQALANGQKAQAVLMAAERELNVIDTRKQQALASLAQALAERDVARLNLGYTVVRSPIDGAIGNRHAHTGAYAQAGTQLLSIVPSHGLWVDANFKEDQLAKIHPGQRVAVTADILPGHVFHGRVTSIAPATGALFSVLPPENATGNFTKIVQRVPVRILLDGHDPDLGTLRPGLSVTAEVDERGQS